MKKYFIFFLLISIILTKLFFIFIKPVSAYTCTCAQTGATVEVDLPSQCGDPCATTAVGSSGTSGSPGGSVSLPNPLPAGTDINIIIGQVINGVLGIVGSLALLMFIYGGFMWMLAAGSAERVKKGKDILVWAVIGLVVIFSAYALVKFLFTNVLGAKPTANSQAQEYKFS